MSNKNKLVEVFDKNALAYDKYRPKYPDQLIEKLIALSGSSPNNQVLEIGCGTGQITSPLLKKGFKITAIEKGKSLADLGRSNIINYPNGNIIHADFETWKTAEQFDLVLSAQAFHWIEMESGINKVSDLLRVNGSFVIVWYTDVSQETPFWKASTHVYDKYFPANKKYHPVPQHIIEYGNYLKHHKHFRDFTHREYLWSKTYDKESYLGLLSTFSDHMTLETKKRKRFFEEIETLIDEFGGLITKHYKAYILCAKKNC